MRIAVMQPYFFPYLGYFQLVNSVDKFVFYDDVNFIKQGWINRNNILVNGRRHSISVPLVNVSSHRAINAHFPLAKGYWQDKILKTLELSYKRAPEFSSVFPIISTILQEASSLSIAELASNSVLKISQFLDLSTNFSYSRLYKTSHLKGEERLIALCREETAHTYINPIGGKNLYSKEKFLSEGLELLFLKPISFEYNQFVGQKFVPDLSVIDVLMFNSKDAIRDALNQFELL